MIDEWLKTLALDDVCQWDVLVFLHHHQSALVPAEQIARLLGYQVGAVVRALDQLEAAGLLQRSRLDKGARWHTLVHVDGPRGPSLDELFKLSETRAGRLAILKALRRARPAKGRSAVTVMKKREEGGSSAARVAPAEPRVFPQPQRRKNG